MGRADAEICVGLLATHSIACEAVKAHMVGNGYYLIVREPAANLAIEILDGLPGVLVEDDPRPRKITFGKVLIGLIIGLVALMLLANLLSFAASV